MGRFRWWPHCLLPCIHTPLRRNSVAPSSQSQGLFPHPVTPGWLVTCFDQHHAADVTLCPWEPGHHMYINVCSPLRGPCPSCLCGTAGQPAAGDRVIGCTPQLSCAAVRAQASDVRESPGCIRQPDPDEQNCQARLRLTSTEKWLRVTACRVRGQLRLSCSDRSLVQISRGKAKHPTPEF